MPLKVEGTLCGECHTRIHTRGTPTGVHTFDFLIWCRPHHQKRTINCATTNGIFINQAAPDTFRCLY